MVGEFLKPDNALKGASSGISRLGSARERMCQRDACSTTRNAGVARVVAYRMIQERRQCRDETPAAAAEEEEEEAEDEEAVQ